MASLGKQAAEKYELKKAEKKSKKKAGEPVERFNLVTYVKNAVIELKKVTWPTRAETLRSTIVVVLFSIAVAGFLGALDFLFSAGLDYIIS